MKDFNYLITVHNKESLLKHVLEGVACAASRTARVIVVLDGCTDRSEDIARKFRATSGLETVLVTAPDVHEIKSINLGLREAKPGYCVLLQDDVILAEPRLEEMVHELCNEHNRLLGYISFRMACDLRCVPLSNRIRLALHLRLSRLLPFVEDYRRVASFHEPRGVAFELQPYGVFASRMAGIKSPVCLTPELRGVEPLLDEAFAPYCYDDCDLSLRALKHGLINGLFPLRFRSDSDWGGTRQDPDFSSDKGAGIRFRNQRLIWKKHRDLIRAWPRRASK
jgi:glycosyltransferase involved in cell wall biosynthesis